jgi:hypothetical protein
MSREKEPRKTVYRDSRDGQFAKKSDAERRPDVHEKERVRIKPPSPSKRGR